MSPAEAHVFVIIGATGDLTRRKLLPALFDLASGGDEIVVLGAATRDLDDDSFREIARGALSESGIDAVSAAAWCDQRLYYQRLGPEGFAALATRIEEIEAAHGLPGNRVFYLALPPPVFPEAIGGLGESGLGSGPGWTRLVVEKPFGRDLQSARALNTLAHRYFDESQIYRIDHYLGKETVQNLLVFRFTNPIFEASWNRDRIERVEVTVAESLGIGSRAGYYDQAGVIRDMLQSHLAQLLTLIAMEPPGSMSAADIRNEKVKVLKAIDRIEPSNVVLGQYTAGSAGGRDLPGYVDTDGVAPGSTTPTYAAVRLEVATWRWQGVPFVLRTGKGMAERLTEVAVTFRPPPVCLFHAEADDCVAQSDVLYLTLQPDEGFRLEIDVKVPGVAGGLRTIPLHFDYAEEFGEIPDAYQTLLGDIVTGDQTLFVHSEEVEESWRLFDPILDPAIAPKPYPAGSWGPPEAAGLLDGPGWAAG